MEENNFQQQELFETEKYISDLVEEKTKRKTSTFNIIFLSSFFTSIIVLSFLFFFGVFDDEEITLPDPVTITETIKEKELVMPRVDSTEIVSICLLYTSDAADE